MTSVDDCQPGFTAPVRSAARCCQCVARCTSAAHPLHDTDAFWHLTLGRSVLAQGARTVPEPAALWAFTDRARAGADLGRADVEGVPALWLGLGLGIYYTLASDEHATALGRALSVHMGVLRIANFATIAFELCGPWLIFMPWWRSGMRTVAFVLFALLRIGIAFTLDVGLFAPIAIAAWTALLPDSTWDRIPRQLRTRWTSTVDGILTCLTFGARRTEPSALLTTSALGSRGDALLCFLSAAMVALWNVSGWGQPPIIQLPDLIRADSVASGKDASKSRPAALGATRGWPAAISETRALANRAPV